MIKSSVEQSGEQQKTALSIALRAVRSQLVSIGVLSLAVNLLMLTAPLYMLQIYDRVLASRNESTLLFLSLLVCFLLLVLGGLELVRSRVLVRISRWLDKVINPVVIRIVLLTGRNSQPVRDLDSIRTFLTGPGLLAFFDAPWTPLFVIAIFLLHPLLGWVATAGAIFLFTLALLNELSTRKPLSEAGRFSAIADRFIDLASRNNEAIRAMAMAPALASRWSETREDAMRLQATGSDRAGTITAIAKVSRLFLQVAVLGMGAHLAINDRLSPGAMIAASIIMMRALAPIEMAIGSWRNFIQARYAYRRLESILSADPPAQQRMELPRPKGELTMDDVSFVPPGQERPTIQNISLHVSVGEILGITGPSAAGKSTLARLMLGVWTPTRGRVAIDGYDLAAWDPVNLGSCVGYLPQDVELFDGRVDENIARFGVFEDKQVSAAAMLANATKVIGNLPQGFNTSIGPGGEVLSGGQRQRIGLARMVYGNPVFVVLDEPSSNLDAEGTQALRATLQSLKQAGVSVVLIAHQPSLLSLSDRILVIEGGCAVALGPSSEILQRITKPVREGLAS